MWADISKFFTGWVVVGIMWLFGSLFMVGVIPLYESRASLARYFRCMVEDLTGNRKPDVVHGQPELVEESVKTGEKSDLDTKAL